MIWQLLRRMISRLLSRKQKTNAEGTKSKGRVRRTIMYFGFLGLAVKLGFIIVKSFPDKELFVDKTNSNPESVFNDVITLKDIQDIAVVPFVDASAELRGNLKEAKDELPFDIDTFFEVYVIEKEVIFELINQNEEMTSDLEKLFNIRVPEIDTEVTFDFSEYYELEEVAYDYKGFKPLELAE